MRERRRIEGLERALAATERSLRSAELAQPFDAEYVNRLVARRAELAAHLRGTESRVVSEIAALLTPEQQRLFAELRLAGATATPRARALEAPAASRERDGERWNLKRPSGTPKEPSRARHRRRDVGTSGRCRQESRAGAADGTRLAASAR